MRALRFAHISDTHLCSRNSRGFILPYTEKVQDPMDSLRLCLEDLAGRNLDFVIHTGDLVHEGLPEDYAMLRRTFEELLPGVPVFLTLGNHDRRGAFRQGYLGLAEDDNSEYYLSQNFQGLRIVSVDTAQQGRKGDASARQMDWLEKLLKTPAPRGTIILQHHPFIDDFPPAFRMPLPHRLLSVMKGGDVIGIFAGHTHCRHFGWAEGIPHFTARALSFGIEYENDRTVYIDQSGYHLCTLEEDGTFTVRDRTTLPEKHILQEKYADPARPPEVFL